MKRYIINLTDYEREELHRLVTTGRHSALKRQHAQILLKTDDGIIDEKIAEHLNVSVRTIERVRKRCAVEGITAALHPQKRPPRELKLDGDAEARLVQLACSEAPEGRQRWTLRLLADKLVQLDVVDSISHETVRQRLKTKRVETMESSKILYPTREKRRVRARYGGCTRSLPPAL
jgi:transposase